MLRYDFDLVSILIIYSFGYRDVQVTMVGWVDAPDNGRSDLRCGHDINTFNSCSIWTIIPATEHDGEPVFVHLLNKQPVEWQVTWAFNTWQ